MFQTIELPPLRHGAQWRASKPGPGTAGRDIEATNFSGGIMFKVIARYAPAIAAFGVLTSASFGVNAQAVGSVVELPSITVRYADLNLNTVAGVEALYARLRTAARSVCHVGERRALVEAMASKDCYRDVLAAAVTNANLPTLTALHRTQNAGRS
jgi:UrcA family protein